MTFFSNTANPWEKWTSQVHLFVVSLVLTVFKQQDDDTKGTKLLPLSTSADLHISFLPKKFQLKWKSFSFKILPAKNQKFFNLKFKKL